MSSTKNPNVSSKRSPPPVDENEDPLRNSDSTSTSTGTSKRPKLDNNESNTNASFALPVGVYLSLPNKMDRTNDDIHSSIDLCPVTKTILDSRPMQRLRSVKQLATAEHVYVNCTHNRLEHSLGVAHLAERLCQRIRKRQPLLQCTAKDVLCVKLAGLLHDIGHGPFSHTYEDFLHQLPAFVEKNGLEEHYQNVPPIPPNYKHETVSLKLIDAILDSKGLRINLEKLNEPLEKLYDDATTQQPDATSTTTGWVDPLSMRVFGIQDEANIDTTAVDTSNILTSRDFVFIKECIWGGPLPSEDPEEVANPKFVGRPLREQEWLYDIVSNRHSGLDVDKIDYFARDHRPAFKGSGEIDKVMIEEAVVAWGACPNFEECKQCQKLDMEQQKHLMICYPEKVVPAAMAFFKQRSKLHKSVYRHKKTDAVGYMVCDILMQADPYFRLNVPPQHCNMTDSSIYEKVPISRAMCNVNAFLRLTDSIIDMIANDPDKRLDKARKLIQRLQQGDFYKCVAVRQLNMKNEAHLKLLGLDGGGKSIDERMKEIAEEIATTKVPDKKGNLVDAHYPNNMKLNIDDLKVECCTIHCGQKDRNPLAKMRFLQKHQIKALDEAQTIEEIPEAQKEDEENYEADIPRTFEEKSIRVFCRDPLKCELASHVFRHWLGEQESPSQQTALTPLRQGPSEGVTPSPAISKQSNIPRRQTVDIPARPEI